MADQKNHSGQKQGNQAPPEQSEQAQGTSTGGTGERSDQDKQQDQRNNPDDARQQPTAVNRAFGT